MRSDKFRIEAEKNEYKIEILSKMLDQEEQRRNKNATKMETQLDYYKRNVEYQNKLQKYEEQQRRDNLKKQKLMENKLEEIEKRVTQLKVSLSKKSPNPMLSLTIQNRK
jgi:hypothetical protein